jgi:hypothetical protein
MTRFLDVRVNSGGPPLSTQIATNTWDGNNYEGYMLSDLRNDIRGKDVLIATHGFNVNRQSGIDSLSCWDGRLQLGSNGIFLGLLWPGDSVWLKALAYPAEPRIANEAGHLIAPWIEQNLSEAASISFASHSLGARVVLATISDMTRRVRRCVIMAGAIDDNCLTGEFKNAASKVDQFAVLASHRDEVLHAAFPLGNIFGGIIASGHPWFRGALGRSGPSKPWPNNFRPPFQILDDWDFKHGSYLEVDTNPPRINPPQEVPQQPGTLAPANKAQGWQEAWTAAFASTRFQ